jgi:Terminase large subunit, T4likevirus-type, N-terminal
VSDVSALKHALFSADKVEFACTALGIVPDEWQERLLRSHAKRILLNCSRQSGKSTMAAIIALHTALYEPGSLTLVLAPAERQTKELMQKILTAYGTLGYKVPADSHRKLGLELRNGSRIEALPGTEKTVRGFSNVRCIIVDEAARIDDSLYLAARPMLAVSGGSLLLLSTPFGKRGTFYEAWSGGSENWERYEVTADDVPRIDEAFLEEERRALGDLWFEQEYYATFTDAEWQLFSSEAIEEMFVDDVPSEMEI